MHTIRLVICAALLAAGAAAAQTLPSPKEHFGFNIGDDYRLANYTQTEAYFKKLAARSDRIKLVDIGPTEEGRRQYMVIVSAPENIKRLDRYRAIAESLAHAEGLTDDQARTMAARGKAVVWIDGGLHADESEGAQQLIETVWQLASRKDEETLRLLRDDVILLVHANPDGQELIANWYMRDSVPEHRTLRRQPRLFHKYIGHDNNRDFFLSAMKETTNMNRVMFVEWFPQIIYNHHQTAPNGTVIAIPPYRNPPNYVFDPIILTGTDAVGAAISNRFNVEGKPGAVTRNAVFYSTWWNGGLRTIAYFHNAIGLLTEITGNPTPGEITFVPARQLPSVDLPFPIQPQKWHLRQSIDYDITANYAVLDYASRQREHLLYDIYRMGKNAIERGSRDSWTPSPTQLTEVVKQAALDSARPKRSPDDEDDDLSAAFGYFAPATPNRYYDLMHKPEWRAPRGYVIPADQPDFPTAVKFVNSLIKTGVQVWRASAAFTVNGKQYPVGSYVVKTAQAYRPHVLDMFEPQDHPNEFRYEGGPPIPPYDMAGWTLALQMGVHYDRILDGFDGPFQRIPYGQLQTPPPGNVAGEVQRFGYLISHRANDAFALINRLLKAGDGAYWLKDAVAGDSSLGPGSLFVPAAGNAPEIVLKAAAELGLDARAVTSRPAGEALRLAPVRIALFDVYGGSMPSGWIRWLLERFEFPFEVVYPETIDAGGLRDRYDVIIIPSGLVPLPKAMSPKVTAALPGAQTLMPSKDSVPPEYQHMLGSITEEKSVPALRAFLEAGGTVIATGSSTNLAYQLGLPIRNALVERARDGAERPLPNEKFYVPGSLLEVTVDPTVPLAWGMEEKTIFTYTDNSLAFKLTPDLVANGIKPVAWIDTPKPLRSGWAWGQAYLQDGMLVAEAPVGAGKLDLMTTDITFRGQPHGTFKLLFNGICLSTATPGP